MNLLNPNTLQPEHVVVCVDGPNADNQAAAWGALNAFNGRIKLAAVVISGTCVSYRPDAPLGSRDDQVSKDVQEMHTARMAGLFARAGCDVPVFVGKPVETTGITTPIPHATHVDHDDYDIFGDRSGLGRGAVAGNFDDALQHIENLNTTVNVVCGGPFTEIAEFTRLPRIRSRLGRLAAQSGFSLSARAIFSKIAFNHEVDEHASLETFLNFPGQAFYVPSDITRAPEATFDGAEELAALGVHPEIVQIFRVHRRHAQERHDKRNAELQSQGKPTRPYPRLSIHDLQAVIALQQGLDELDSPIFAFDQVNPDEAVSNMITASRLSRETSGRPAVITPDVVSGLGYLGRGQTLHGVMPARFVVTSQNIALYKRHAATLLRGK